VDKRERFIIDRPYFFTFAVSNTLSLTARPNKNNLNEQEYLQDYGRNIDSETVRDLAQRWREAGHFYGLTSLMGRSLPEPHLFVGLASALATVCRGYVIVMNDGILDLGVGVYSPEQFKLAQPRF